jgi:cytochrome c peroxidase
MRVAAAWRRLVLVFCTLVALIAIGGNEIAKRRLTPQASREVELLAWSAADIALLQSLSLEALPVRPVDPSNAFASDSGAAALGKRLFMDQRLSAGGRVSCASCHRPHLAFTDGLRTSRGLSTGARNTPTLLGAAYQRTFNWDGRIDTLWGQALGPLEATAEMGSTRVEVVRVMAQDVQLRADFERVFGPIEPALLAAIPQTPCGPVSTAAGSGSEDSPGTRCWRTLSEEQRRTITRVFVNIGKAIAAYEATLRPVAGRFDQFVRYLVAGDTSGAARQLTLPEQRGLRLFIAQSRTACLNCHNGPLFSNGGFHDIGTNLGQHSSHELGHMLGAQLLQASEFRCEGPFSDALPAQCLQARFQDSTFTGEGRGAFKVPTLRGVAATAPYMHDGRFGQLNAVLAHYRSPPMKSVSGAHELKPLQLSDEEAEDLLQFLRVL